jgi:ribosomal protein L15
LERDYHKLLKQGLVKEEKGVYTVTLDALGIDKLLSKGTVKHKWNITAKYASESAVEKIKQAGGTVTITA